jgi:hypothetical protein
MFGSQAHLRLHYPERTSWCMLKYPDLYYLSSYRQGICRFFCKYLHLEYNIDIHVNLLRLVLHSNDSVWASLQNTNTLIKEIKRLFHVFGIRKNLAANMKFANSEFSLCECHCSRTYIFSTNMLFANANFGDYKGKKILRMDILNANTKFANSKYRYLPQIRCSRTPKPVYFGCWHAFVNYYHGLTVAGTV